MEDTHIHSTLQNAGCLRSSHACVCAYVQAVFRTCQQLTAPKATLWNAQVAHISAPWSISIYIHDTPILCGFPYTVLPTAACWAMHRRMIWFGHAQRTAEMAAEMNS